MCVCVCVHLNVQMFTIKLLDKMKARIAAAQATGATEPLCDLSEDELLALAKRQAYRLAKQAERDRM